MWNRFTPTTLCASALVTISGAASADQHEDLSGPMEDVKESIQVIQQMKHQGDDLGRGLDAARAVFVVPDYATAALIVGGAGGEGVLFDRRNGEFGNPVFYDIASLSIGAQAGASAGAIAMLLMTDDAVESFKQENNFSLNAEAGLTIVNWSAEAEWSAGKGDVVVWTDTEGLQAEAAVGVSDMNFDAEETQQYYNQPVTPEQILAGNVENPHARELRSEFAAFTSEGAGVSEPDMHPDREPGMPERDPGHPGDAEDFGGEEDY